jgi:cleavage and polyadenylation specificity factor subunit 3
MNEPSDFQAMDGRKVPLKMSVDYISFSAHVDFTQNSKFIDDVKAPHVVSIFSSKMALYSHISRSLFMAKQMPCIV